MKSSSSRLGAAGLAFVVAACSVAGPALGQPRERLSGGALDQLELATPGDPSFGVPSGTIGSHFVPRAAIGFDYAHRPLVATSGAGAIVGAQGFVHAALSLALWDRLLLSADMPFAVVQSGDDPVVDGITIESPSSVAPGDLRLGGRVRLVGSDGSPFQLAPGVYGFLPTGDADDLAGDGSARIEPHLGLGGELASGSFVWSAAVGYRFRTSDAPDAIRYGASVALRFADERVQIGPEAYASTDVGDGQVLRGETVQITAPTLTSAELLLGLKVRPVSDLSLGVAAGPGLSSAIGTPAFRAVAVVAWSPAPAKAVEKKDSDGDGIGDVRDACPNRRGLPNEDPKQNGCPGRDRDGDGVPDALDACLEVPGAENGDPRLSGCPLDGDGDGVIDVADACPSTRGDRSPDAKRNGCPLPRDADGDGIVEGDACPMDAGIATNDPATNGCPDDGKRDRDGDGVANNLDACPNEKGATDPDPTKNGCPREVRVTEGEIVILRQIQFRFGASSLDQTIDPVSDDLLTEVRNVIHEHPEITRIEVQGHTDALGAPSYNAVLSQARAESVKKWLVARGIPANKLVAKGYGSSQPLASNDTEAGRQKNRRVQFVIVSKK